MEYLFYFLILMLGGAFASFVSVYVERGQNDKFFSLKNKSICAACLRKLNFFELVPIFSYLFLRGKCRTCKTKIPLKLFVAEIVLGIWFLSSYFYFLNLNGDILKIFLCWVFGSIFLLLCLQDLENMEVSSSFVYLLVTLSFISVFANFSLESFIPILVISPFWFIYFINKNWIGEADPYIYTALALFFGKQFSISLLLYSIWFGAAYGIFYLAFINKKFTRGVRIPFLPIIFFSTIFILIFNYHIIDIQAILMLNESFYFS
jgi:prepilin signal peptidase PulO-like enzyme (type II secretory pathway)